MGALEQKALKRSVSGLLNLESDDFFYKIETVTTFKRDEDIGCSVTYTLYFQSVPAAQTAATSIEENFYLLSKGFKSQVEALQGQVPSNYELAYYGFFDDSGEQTGDQTGEQQNENLKLGITESFVAV